MGEPFGDGRRKLVEEYRRGRLNGTLSKDLLAGGARIVGEDPLIASDICDYRSTQCQKMEYLVPVQYGKIHQIIILDI